MPFNEPHKRRHNDSGGNSKSTDEKPIQNEEGDYHYVRKNEFLKIKLELCGSLVVSSPSFLRSSIKKKKDRNYKGPNFLVDSSEKTLKKDYFYLQR